MENKKNVIKEEELEKVTGGAAAFSALAGNTTTGIKFEEPTSPFTTVNNDVLAKNSELQTLITLPDQPGLKVGIIKGK